MSPPQRPFQAILSKASFPSAFHPNILLVFFRALKTLISEFICMFTCALSVSPPLEHQVTRDLGLAFSVPPVLGTGPSPQWVLKHLMCA